MIMEGDKGCNRRMHVVILDKIFTIPLREVTPGLITGGIYLGKEKGISKIAPGSSKCKKVAR